jgi:hypothetical protein
LDILQTKPGCDYSDAYDYGFATLEQIKRGTIATAR